MSDKDKIRNRYIQMYQTKEEFIQAVQNGTLNYDSVRHRSIDVRLHENEAELTGKSLVHASVFGADGIHGACRLTVP